jgi:hypothetical protein
MILCHISLSNRRHLVRPRPPNRPFTGDIDITHVSHVYVVANYLDVVDKQPDDAASTRSRVPFHELMGRMASLFYQNFCFRLGTCHRRPIRCLDDLLAFGMLLVSRPHIFIPAFHIHQIRLFHLLFILPCHYLDPTDRPTNNKG